MLKNKTALSLSPLALLTLAACGGSSVASKSGKAQKGPLENARAFLDYNDNGVWNKASEPGALTDSSGAYVISETLLPSTGQTTAGYSLVVTTDGLTVDTSTGAVLSGVTMSAPTTSSMITPVTTLVEEGGLTQAQVVAALGLPATFDPMTFDAFSTTLTALEKTTALAAEKVAQKVMAAVTTFAAVAQGSGVSPALAFEGAMSSVIAQVAVASGASTTMTVSASDIDAISTLMAAQYDAGGKFKAVVDAGTATKATYTTQATSTTDAIKNVAAAITAVTSEDLADSKDLFSVVQVMQDQVKAAAVSTQTSGIATAVAIASTTDANGDGIADIVATAAANKAPTAIALSSSSVIESAASLVVGTVTTTDADNASGHTYSIVNSAGTDFADFTITSAGVLSLNAQPDYETKTSYTVAVSTTDAGGKTFADTFTVSITDDTTEGGAFGISSDTVTWTDYNPVSALAAAADITHTLMTTTTGTQVTLGSTGHSGALSLKNLTNLFDNDVSTIGKSPNLTFTLDTVPTGTGNATITATIIDGTDGTRTGSENEISVTIAVAYVGDGTSATITAAAGATASGSFTKGDGTSVSFTTEANTLADAYSITASNAATGTPASMVVKLEALYDAFITGAGRSDLLEAGNYNIAVETTLPLQNYANDSVTKFIGQVNLTAGTTKSSIVGTDGADTITGTVGAEVISSGGGKDTISTGDGADYIILAAGTGSTTLANSNTVSDFTNGTDKFALHNLTYSQLTVVADANTTADTVISITATSTTAEEYLMTVTGVAYGLIQADDFVLAADIV